MSASNTRGSADEFKGNPDGIYAESAIHAEHTTRPESIHPNLRAFNATPLVSLGIAVAVGVLLQNPGVRKACRSVLQDPQVQKACREAGETVCREVAASWHRHGGMTVIANAFLR